MTATATLRPLTRLAPALPLALTLLAAACSSPQPAAPADAGAWHRTDLWLAEPRVEAAPDSLGNQRSWARHIGVLGASEVRDMTQVTPFQLQQIPHLAASEIRALEQVQGTRLAYRVELGQAPYLSFIPLINEQHPWPTSYKVSVRPPGGEPVVAHERLETIAVPPAQAVVDVDLGAFAGQTVDVLLEVDALGAGGKGGGRIRRSVWGSPAVYSRIPLDHEPPGSPERPNVVLIGADTLRADAIGVLGGDPDVTPAIDQLASESDLWPETVSCFNVTNPSFASLMTGLYGKNHGVYDLRTQLPESFTTLAEEFSGAGYDTLAIIAARHLGNHNSGLGQGFDETSLSELHYSAELVIDQGMDWISGRRKPFFVWLHLFDPHTPHTPPAPYALGFHQTTTHGLSPDGDWRMHRTPGWPGYSFMPLGGSRELYQGEVAYLDRQVDRLMGFLRSQRLLENTIVVFVADHGENLADHGVRFGHHGLFETTTRVPLMIRWPGAEREGRRIPGLVQNVDVFPTLLAAAGIPVPDNDGENLLEITGDGKRGRRAAFSEHSHAQGARIRTPDFSYMVSEGSNFFPDGRYLYDLRTDPHETRNLAGTGLAQEEELQRALHGWLSQRRQLDRPRPVDLTQEDIDKLKALGYL
ncbi:MAG: sulfatase [Acidobacteria bacterium]|nr:sulfatase [Acidobacteriota bacterium]